MVLDGFRWFRWFWMDLGGSGTRVFVGLWRPVAACGTGVVGPKERLLQSQTAVSEAWRPVGCRLGGWD